jgi:signal transduction histidine kinase
MSLAVEVEEGLRDREVQADSASLERILLNLVDNACKYAVSAQDRRIHLQVARAGPRILLRVRDHGPGIAEHEVRRLFRPFSKSAREAAQSAPGVGLGLALSRRLARAMQGDLIVERGPTEGATFALILKLAHRAEPGT